MQNGAASSPDSELKSETFALLFGLFLHTEEAAQWNGTLKHSQLRRSCSFSVSWHKALLTCVVAGSLREKLGVKKHHMNVT